MQPILLPVETPWSGTPRSPLFLLETPYRQLIPFSLFDPGLSDANMLVMAKIGRRKNVHGAAIPADGRT